MRMQAAGVTKEEYVIRRQRPVVDALEMKNRFWTVHESQPLSYATKPLVVGTAPS